MDHFQGFFRSDSGLFPGEALILGPKADILEDRGLEELMLRVLEDHADLQPQIPQLVVLGIDVLLSPVNFPLTGPQETIQMLDQSRLTGASVADDSDKGT